jgi:two-component system cell cycle sensor histidine kinase/response regulator CckA
MGSIQLEYVKVEIIDSGEGIDKGCIDHIFDPFYSTKEVGKGSGLGLASVHSLVKTYGGAISVDSKVDVGSVFTILLPCSNEVLELPSNEILLRLESEKYLLLAEDDKVIASALSEFLIMQGYDVTVAFDSESALDLIKQRKNKADQFHLLIADLNMPKVDGNDFLEQLSSFSPHTKTIVSTGDPSRLSLKGPYKQEFGAVLLKPYGFSELGKTIRTLLGC